MHTLTPLLVGAGAASFWRGAWYVGHVRYWQVSYFPWTFVIDSFLFVIQVHFRRQLVSK
jgi:hypothetical protein